MFIGAENMFTLVRVELTITALFDPYRPGRSSCQDVDFYSRQRTHRRGSLTSWYFQLP